MDDGKLSHTSFAPFDCRFWRKHMVRFDMPVQPVVAVGRTDRNGLCAAAEEIKNLPFGKFPSLCPVTTSWRKASAKSPPTALAEDATVGYLAMTGRSLALAAI